MRIAGIGKSVVGGSTNLELERRLADRLTELLRAVFRVLDRGNDPLALREIRVRQATPASIRQVRRALARLNELGLASSAGHGVAARWSVVHEK